MTKSRAIDISLPTSMKRFKYFSTQYIGGKAVLSNCWCIIHVFQFYFNAICHSFFEPSCKQTYATLYTCKHFLISYRDYYVSSKFGCYWYTFITLSSQLLWHWSRLCGCIGWSEPFICRLHATAKFFFMMWLSYIQHATHFNAICHTVKCNISLIFMQHTTHFNAICSSF